jgi:hypothetical protein
LEVVISLLEERMDVFNNLLVSNGAKANLVVPLLLAVSVMGVALLDALEGGRPLDLIDAGYIGFTVLKPGDVVCGFQVSVDNKIQDRFFFRCSTPEVFFANRKRSHKAHHKVVMFLRSSSGDLGQFGSVGDLFEIQDVGNFGFLRVSTLVSDSLLTLETTSNTPGILDLNPDLTHPTQLKATAYHQEVLQVLPFYSSILSFNSMHFETPSCSDPYNAGRVRDLNKTISEERLALLVDGGLNPLLEANPFKLDAVKHGFLCVLNFRGVSISDFQRSPVRPASKLSIADVGQCVRLAGQATFILFGGSIVPGILDRIFTLIFSRAGLLPDEGGLVIKLFDAIAQRVITSRNVSWDPSARDLHLDAVIVLSDTDLHAVHMQRFQNIHASILAAPPVHPRGGGRGRDPPKRAEKAHPVGGKVVAPAKGKKIDLTLWKADGAEFGTNLCDHFFTGVAGCRFGNECQFLHSHPPSRSLADNLRAEAYARARPSFGTRGGGKK